MPKAVLIAIDLLVDYFERRLILAGARERLATAVNDLTIAFRRHSHPIVWVRQEFAPDLHDAFLDMRERGVPITIVGTKGSKILPELERSSTDIIIVKKRYSAFFETEIATFLSNPEILDMVGPGAPNPSLQPTPVARG